MPENRRSTYREPRTLNSDLAGLRRDGFFRDLLTLFGFGGAVALMGACLVGLILGVAVIFDAVH